MKEINLTKPNMLQILSIIDEWKGKYHHDKSNVIFQNKKLLTNIVFDNHSLHTISQNNPTGFENIPDALINPSEVWSYWQDSKNQDIVIRHYILIGEKKCYICITKMGVIQNAFVFDLKRLDQYRKGALMLH